MVISSRLLVNFIPKLRAELQFVFNMTLEMISYSSLTAVQVYVICLVYVFKRRVILLHSAVLSFRCWLNRRNEACTIRRTIKAVDRRSHILRLRFIYKNLLDVYAKVKHFYSHYFRYQVASIALVITFDLLINIMVRNSLSLTIMVMNTVGYLVLPVCVVRGITSHLRDIHGLIHGVY